MFKLPRGGGGEQEVRFTHRDMPVPVAGPGAAAGAREAPAAPAGAGGAAGGAGLGAAAEAGLGEGSQADGLSTAVAAGGNDGLGARSWY